MKQVNKDYIGIVKKNSGRFSFEKLKIQKSEQLIDELTTMAYHSGFTLNDMLSYLSKSSLFVYFALPFYEHCDETIWDEAPNVKIKTLVDSLDKQKTKVNFLERALELIQECDYRCNVMQLDCNPQDCVLRTFAEYESQSVLIDVTDDISIWVNAHNVGGDFAAELSFTVMKGGVPVLPYRSLIELYECSEDIIETTRMFDPEVYQWENFMRTLVATANEILDLKEDYFKKAVIEDGLMMADKITQMCTDINGYLNWLTYYRTEVQVEYSDNDANPTVLDTYDEQYRELYKIYSVGLKLSCAMYLAENLKEWSQFGEQYENLADIYEHMIKFAPEILQMVETACKQFPDKFFDEKYRGEGLDEIGQRMVALNMLDIAADLKDWLNINTNE